MLSNKRKCLIHEIIAAKEHLLPGLSDWELLLLIVETMLIGPDVVRRPYTLYVTRHISNKLFIIRGVNSDMPTYI